MERKVAERNGMGLAGSLTLILVVLKLFHLIDLSWVWVFSPVWISALLVVAVFSVILVGGRIKTGRW